MTTRYTPEQIDAVLALRLGRGLEYKNVANEFETRFGVATTAEQMRHVVREASRRKPGAPTVVPARALAAPVAEVVPHPLAAFTRDSISTSPRQVGDGLYIVTAATPTTSLSSWETVDGHRYGRNLCVPFWDAMTRFCSEMDATRIVLPMRAHMPALRDQPLHYDPRLWSHRDAFASEVSFCENLQAMDIFLNPQQTEPLTGLFRLQGRATGVVDGDGNWRPVPGRPSLLIAHSKQDRTPYATGNGTHPRILHSTGACTLPEYLKNRVGRIAADTHVIGALVVLVRGDQFHCWAVQAHPIDGSFCLGRWKFSADAVEGVSPLALKLGDLHPGWDDQAALDFERELIRELRPPMVVVEDWLDGATVSHHLKGKHLERQSVRKKPGFGSLEAELTKSRERLLAIWEASNHADLCLTESNHPEHISRWLDEARYIGDDANYEIGHRMVVDVLDGKHVLRYRIDPLHRFKWLEENDDLIIAGVQFACHGHLGANGAKGSSRGIGKHLGAVMLAHSHSASILGRTFTVGHSSAADHGYNRPPSTWSVTHGATYAGGQCTLYDLVNGESGLGALPIPHSCRVGD